MKIRFPIFEKDPTKLSLLVFCILSFTASAIFVFTVAWLAMHIIAPGVLWMVENVSIYWFIILPIGALYVAWWKEYFIIEK